MPKTKISEFSATPANNTDIDSINIAEGCAPSGINDAIRELMAQLKDFQTGAVGDSFNGPVGTTTAAAGAFTTLSASSTVSGTGFSTYLASPPAIGGTAAAAGSFTTLSASGNVTLSGGTANGVAYLNGSKVVTSGSALTFDGTNLGVGGAATSFGAGFPTLTMLATSGAGIFQSKNTAGDTRLYANTDGDAYLGSWANTSLRMYTNSTIKATLDSSGNLGLGVTPSAWAAGFKAMQIGSGAAFWGPTGTGIPYAYMSANQVYDTTSTSKYLQNNFATWYIQETGAHKWFNAPSGTAGNAITFTQAMSLTADGNLLVGVTSGNARLRVLSTASQSQSAYITHPTFDQDVISCENSATSGDNKFISFYTDATVNRGNISYNRTAGLVAYNTTSDYRAKDIYGPISDSGALIDSVPVYMGKMKGATQERPMFIAHETPEYAHTGEKDAVDKDGNPVYQQMDASALIPVMWAEIQSLRKRLADAGIA